MIRRLMILCSIVPLTGAAALTADAPAPTIVAPSQIHWKPGTGPLEGTQVAHYHPVLENVTVLLGTLVALSPTIV